MTTTMPDSKSGNPTPDLPMPAGAESVGDWDRHPTDRGRKFQHVPLEIEDAILTIQGMQYANGTTGRSILIRLKPDFEGDDAADLTPRYARKLAAMLLNLADTCEILDGVKR